MLTVAVRQTTLLTTEQLAAISIDLGKRLGVSSARLGRLVSIVPQACERDDVFPRFFIV